MSDLLDRLRSAVADKYAIESEIGRGSMAVVFLAEDLKHHRRVAIKVLNPELGAVVGGERFSKEVETVARLTHPHILPLHDSGEADGLLYYVMPWVRGESLRKRLDREKQLPFEDALRITREVADALEHAHRNGVVHRDIKPGNILLEEGHAVVTDFGVARSITDSGGETLTATGLAVGSPAYMSPEQAAGEEVDGRSDIYALGCVLYEMLSGEPPYTGPTPHAVLAKRLSEPVPHVSTLRETVPEIVERAITKALARTPADRFSTAVEFSEALTTLVEPGIGDTGSERRREGLSWGLIGLAGIIAAVVLTIAVQRGLVSPAEDPAATMNHLAVLPCANRLGDPEQDYIPEGVHDEVVNGLGRIAPVEVRGRRSVTRYRDTAMSLQEIAGELGVEGLVECSVYRVGDSVRVTASLLDAPQDRQLWSDTYQRPVEEVFLLGTDVARGVAGALQANVTPTESARLEARPTESQEALTHYHRGRYFTNSWTPDGIQRGIEHFEQAIALDSSFALAYAGLAEAIIMQGDIMGVGDIRPIDFMPTARELVLKALDLDADLADAHNMLGYIRWNHDYDYADADRESRLATELDPTSAAAWDGRAIFLSMMNRDEEALVAGRRAVELDPVAAWIHSDVGAILLAAGEYREALETAGVAMELDPALPSAHGIASGAWFALGNDDLAVRFLEQADSLSDHPLYRGILARAYGKVGNREGAREILDELTEMLERRYVPPRAFANAYIGLDSLDAAMEWLIRAAERRDPSLHWEIRTERIRDHPRYAELLRMMRLEP